MTCPHYINAINTTTQTMTAGDYLEFNSVVNRGNCIQFISGGNAFGLKCKGVYLISVDADATADTAGAITMQIDNNGTIVSGATGTSNGTTATHLHAQCTVKINPSCCCIDNSANIQVQILQASTVANANIFIDRIA